MNSSVMSEPPTIAHSTKMAVNECQLVLVLLFLFLSFNVITATSYPFPNVDEAMIAEPAINFLRGIGFRIRFSEIVVLYPFLLVPWLKTSA